MNWFKFGIQMAGLVACLVAGGCIQKFFSTKFGIGKSIQNNKNGSVEAELNKDSIKNITAILEKQDIQLKNKKIKIDNSFSTAITCAVAERYMERGFCKKIDAILEKLRDSKKLKIENEQDIIKVALPIIVNKLENNVTDLEKFVQIAQTKGLDKLTHTKGLDINKDNLGQYFSIIRQYKLHRCLGDFAELIAIGELSINKDNFENHCLLIKQNKLRKSIASLVKLVKMKPLGIDKNNFASCCKLLSAFGEAKSLDILVEIAESAQLNSKNFSDFCRALQHNKKVDRDSLEKLKIAFSKAPKKKSKGYEYLMELVEK